MLVRERTDNEPRTSGEGSRELDHRRRADDRTAGVIPADPGPRGGRGSAGGPVQGGGVGADRPAARPESAPQRGVTATGIPLPLLDSTLQAAWDTDIPVRGRPHPLCRSRTTSLMTRRVS